jgi:hypothetical protein
MVDLGDGRRWEGPRQVAEEAVKDSLGRAAGAPIYSLRGNEVCEGAIPADKGSPYTD